MKKLLFIIALLPTILSAQYSFNSNSVQTSRIALDNTLSLPSGCGVPSGATTLRGGFTNRPAAYFDTCGHKLYIWDNSLTSWKSLSFSDSTIWATVTKVKNDSTLMRGFINALIADSVYQASQIALRVKYADTAAMLNPGYTRATRFLDSISAIRDLANTRITKSDADTYYPSISRTLDSIAAVRSYGNTKLSITDASSIYITISRTLDSLAAIQARIQSKEPLLGFTPVPNTRTINGYALTGNITLNKSDVGLGNVDNTSDLNKPISTATQTALDGKQNTIGYTPENVANKATDFTTVNNTLYPTVQAVNNAITTATGNYVPLSQKGANNGVATLDVGGKVPFSQLPAALFIYKGTWNVSTNSPALSDGTGVAGWIYVVSTGGTINLGSGNITFSAGDYALHNGSTWERSVGTNNVASVNGQQGVVTLTTANISESGNLYYTDTRVQTYGDGRYPQLTGSYSNPSWITGLAWSKITGAPSFLTSESDPVYVASSWYSTTNNASNWNTAYSWGNHAGLYPTYNGTGATGTWGISVTGNAASATNATQWNGREYDHSEAGVISSLMSYDASIGKYFYSTNASIKTWLGLGSYAYRSSGLAELSGANFSGAVTSTSVSSGQISATGPGGSAVILYGSYSGSPANAGMVINNYLGTTTFSHNSNGGATTTTGTMTAASFSGAGTGLNGTAAALNIGGVSGGISLTSLGSGSVNVNYGYTAVLRNETGAQGNIQYAPILNMSAGDTHWQLQGDYYSSSTLRWRAGYNGTWYSWREILHDGNYNSYSPTLTGTGASGTWGINITGNAASANNWNSYNQSLITSGITYMMTYNGSGWGYSSAGTVQGWLGLGSNAYTSTSFLPLSAGIGNRITGDLFITNGYYFRGRNTGNTADIAMIGIGSSGSAAPNKVFIDPDNNGTQFGGSIGGSIGSFSSSLSAPDIVASSAMYLRYNGSYLYGRNGADNAYIPMIRINGSDQVSIDNNGVGTVFGGSITATLVRSTGDVIAYYSSDRRLKNNIKPINNALGMIDRIGGYSYTWNNKQEVYTGRDYGVIAQEIEQIMPEAVTTRSNGYKAVKYERLIPLLIQAVKELKHEIELLKK